MEQSGSKSQSEGRCRCLRCQFPLPVLSKQFEVQFLQVLCVLWESRNDFCVSATRRTQLVRQAGRDWWSSLEPIQGLHNSVKRLCHSLWLDATLCLATFLATASGTIRQGLNGKLDEQWEKQKQKLTVQRQRISRTLFWFCLILFVWFFFWVGEAVISPTLHTFTLHTFTLHSEFKKDKDTKYNERE